MSSNQFINSTSNILFVADLPKETTYEDLSILFQPYHFQYASLNNSKASSVWAKVCLETEDFALKAKHELNGEILVPKFGQGNSRGKPVRICTYENRGMNGEKNFKQSLLVKNLDMGVSQKEFYQLFLKYGEIDSAKIEYDEQGNSKGFGYIYYHTEEGANKAKENLNQKEYKGKIIEIVNLIPSKSKGLNSNALFVMNFPKDFTDNDLKKLFEKYGEVKYVSIYKDKNGQSRGYGVISFETFEATSQCITDTKINQINFPGLPPLVVKYAAKKEDREKKNLIGGQMNKDYLRIQFNLCFATGAIESELDLEKEIRLFIKVVLLQEYNPEDVLVDFGTMSGIVTFINRRDYDLYLQKYEEFCLSRVPAFECFPYISVQPEQPVPINPMIIPNQFPPQMSPTPIPMQQFPPNMPMQMMPGNKIQPPMNNQRMPIGIPPQMQQMPPMLNQPGFIPPNQMPMPMINVPGGNYPNQGMPMPMEGGQNSGFPNMVLLNNEGGNHPMRQMRGRNQNFRGRGKGKGNYNNQMHPPRIITRNQNDGFNNVAKAMPPNQFNQMWPNPNMMPQPQMIMQPQEDIDQRNLQNLNPSQLQSQFTNQPVKHLFTPELFNDDNEEIANEIADSIYEVASQRHPNEAAKITGMIKEMGIQKMNMLLSKKEDLYEMIDKAYEMINESSEK